MWGKFGEKANLVAGELTQKAKKFVDGTKEKGGGGKRNFRTKGWKTGSPGQKERKKRRRCGRRGVLRQKRKGRESGRKKRKVQRFLKGKNPAKEDEGETARARKPPDIRWGRHAAGKTVDIEIQIASRQGVVLPPHMGQKKGGKESEGRKKARKGRERMTEYANQPKRDKEKMSGKTGRCGVNTKKKDRPR